MGLEVYYTADIRRALVGIILAARAANSVQQMASAERQMWLNGFDAAVVSMAASFGISLAELAAMVREHRTDLLFLEGAR